MRIVQVLAMEGRWGGRENHTFGVCQELAKTNGVHLIIGQKYRDKLPQIDNLNYHYIDFARSRWNFWLLWQLYQCILKIQPDIIHAQGGKAAKIIAVLSHFFRFPCVATVHGMKNHLRDYLRFGRVIVVSGQVAEKFRDIRDVIVIHNGVQAELIQTCSKRIDKPRAIAIGRLDTVKGFDRLIQAWIGVNFHLDIIGDGSERARLQGLIDQNGLQDHVHLLGFKDNVNQELVESQFLIISSLKEGGPIVLAEALLQDIPVIATDVGMVREFIPTQYIAKTAAIEDLQQLLEYTFSHLDHLSNDFETAFLKAKNSLTLTAMTNKTIAVYQTLI